MLLVIDNLSDCLPLINTDWVQSAKKYIIQFIMDGDIKLFHLLNCLNVTNGITDLVEID